MSKEERKEYKKEWAKKNAERVKQKQKEWYEINKERILEKQKENIEEKHLYNKIYTIENKDKINKRVKEYRIKNKEKVAERERLYRKNNREKINKTKRLALLNDPLKALTKSVRNSILQAFKRNNYTKKSRTHDILGCSFEEFKKHIEDKFEDWMNWDNRGKYNGEFKYGWDIDHKIPLDSATTEKELLTLLHYSNLQPLCSKINRDIKKNNLS